MNIPSRKEVIKEARENGRKIAAVLPIHYPRELLRAFGYEPVEVWGPPRTRSREGVAHLQPYICSIIVQSLSFFIEEGFDAVDLIFVPHTCDSMQGLASILKHFMNKKPIVFMYHPRKKGEPAERFMVMELKKVYDELKAITGRNPGEDALMEAIKSEEEADRMFSKLIFNRVGYNLSDREFYTALRTREYLPPKHFVEVAEKIPPANKEIKGKKVVLSGILPEPMELFDWINKAGGIVVADDMACLSRRAYPEGQSDEPFRRMAERLLSSPPDSTRGVAIDERVEWLKKTVKRSNADCVLLYNVKFCEPELFYVPVLEKELRKAGIPFMYVEHEINQPFPQAIFNRIQSFLEE